MNRPLYNAITGSLGLLAVCGFAVAQPAHDVERLAYYTGFESPAYMAGPLLGQDGWAVSPAGTAKDSAMVAAKTGPDGSQAVRIQTDRLGGDALWQRPIDFASTVGAPIVDVEWDVQLTQEKVLSEIWAFNICGDGGNLLCSVSVDAGMGDTVCYQLGELGVVQTDTILARNCWNHFRVRLDFVGGTADFYLNGAYLNPLGMRSEGVPGLRPEGVISAIGFGVTRPAHDLTYLDNISIRRSRVECPANCDQSWTRPLLNVNDFLCFMNEFAAAQSLPPKIQINSYANFDGSVVEPILNVNDFVAFMSAYATGCP